MNFSRIHAEENEHFIYSEHLFRCMMNIILQSSDFIKKHEQITKNVKGWNFEILLEFGVPFF